MTGILKKDRSRIADRFRCVTNDRKGHQKWNVSFHTSTCKSQQQVHEKL